MTFFDILKSISIPEHMGCRCIDSDDLTPSANEYINKVLRSAKLNSFDIEYHNGASQLCFIESEMDRVFKIPFDGISEEWETYNEKIDEYEWNEEWSPFKTNYTAKAVTIYNDAVKAGVEEFFADIRVEGMSYNKVPIYSQAFVTPEEDNTNSIHTSEDSLSKARAIKEKRSIPFHTNWVAVCIEKYGQDKFNQLMDFIYDNDISDLHDGNYGFTRDGRPMILDYSSFNN